MEVFLASVSLALSKMGDKASTKLSTGAKCVLSLKPTVGVEASLSHQFIIPSNNPTMVISPELDWLSNGAI